MLFFRISAKRTIKIQSTMSCQLVFLILTMLASTSLAMKADDICFLKKDSSMAKCEEKYRHQCGAEHCSVDKNSCKNFLYSSFIVKSMKILKTYEKESESVIMFLENIKECSPPLSNTESIDACKKSKRISVL